MVWFIFSTISVFGVVWLSPSVSGACSVCFSAKGASLYAYYGTTALLLLLPLSMVAVCAAWLYYRSRNPPP